MFRPVTPLEALFDRYGLDRPTGFRPMDTGLLNRSYQVTAGGRRYFLKHYLPNAEHEIPDETGRMRSIPQTIRFQHRAADALAATGVPAAAPLSDRDGRTLVQLRGRRFALFPWFEGCHRAGSDLDVREAAHLGEVLARIHTGLATVLPPVPQPLFVPTKPLSAALAEADLLLGLARSRRRPDAMDELAEYRLAERRRMLPELAHRRPGPDVLGEVGYIHGDFHMGNVFWSSQERGSHVTTVVDWDKTAVGPYGDEFVKSALVFFADRHSGLLDLESVRGFVSGYVAERPQMDAKELTAAVHRVWWERLTDFWILVWRYQRDDPRPDSLFPGTAALVPWWTDNYEKVLEAFLSPADGARRNPVGPDDPGVNRNGGVPRPRLDPPTGSSASASPLIASLTDTVQKR